MGFIVPKVKAPPAPLEPSPTPKMESIEQETLTDISEKQRRRKGLESTLLSQQQPDTTPLLSTPPQPTSQTTLG